MGYIDLAGLRHVLPDGRELFADVSFRVGEGAKVALVGPNGAGKTTLLRMVSGDLPVSEGRIGRPAGPAQQILIGGVCLLILAAGIWPEPLLALSRAAARVLAGVDG